jgi:hypothetical protein
MMRGGCFQETIETIEDEARGAQNCGLLSGMALLTILGIINMVHQDNNYRPFLR